MVRIMKVFRHELWAHGNRVSNMYSDAKKPPSWMTLVDSVKDPAPIAGIPVPVSSRPRRFVVILHLWQYGKEVVASGREQFPSGAASMDFGTC